LFITTCIEKHCTRPLSYVYRSAKFFNFFTRLFILFYRSPMYETFRTESKLK